MYIETVPNRNSPPAILLCESYRQNGKVCKRTLCNLSDWPVAHVCRATIKVRKPVNQDEKLGALAA